MGGPPATGRLSPILVSRVFARCLGDSALAAQSLCTTSAHLPCPCSAAPCCMRAPVPLPGAMQVGMIACNDYILLECCIYRVLKKHFRSHAAYGQLMDLFHEVGEASGKKGL